MSDSEKTEADSTTKQEESKKEDTEQVESSLPTNGSVKEASNGLSAQLEEKIIRQVEVGFDHVVTTGRGFDLFTFCSTTLGTGTFPGTNSSSQQQPRVKEDVSLSSNLLSKQC